MCADRCATISGDFYKWMNKSLLSRFNVFRSRKTLLLLLLLVVPSLILYVVDLPLSSLFYTAPDVIKPCKLHKLDPWDETVKPYLTEPADVHCSDKPTPIYVNDSGYLVFNHTLFTSQKLSSLECVYQKAIRNGDKVVSFKHAIHIRLPVFVPCRTFRVKCRDKNGRARYDFVHANVAADEEETSARPVGRETDEELSIIFLGLDSASRSHFLRTLPKTYTFLTQDIGAYDFKGYMKVGQNSFPNLFPLLTGQNSQWQVSATLLHTYMDKLPFIWKDPKMADYASHLSEDRPDISTFNYIKGGFKYPPVEYYFRPFSLAMGQIEPIIEEPLGKSSWHCYGNRDHFHIQLEYLKHFITKYKGKKKFAFLWNNQMGHEDFTSLSRADTPVLEFIRWMQENGHLNRSVLLVGSDHGFRLGGFSNTYIGRLENNMPFLSVYVPSALTKKYTWIHKNILRNTEQLVSPYDVHSTLLDILHSNYVDNRPKDLSNVQTSRSLFNRMPGQRSCLDAGIPAQFCTCDDMVSLDTSLPLVNKLGMFAVGQINLFFKNHTDVCVELTLQRVTDVKVAFSTDGDTESTPVQLHRTWFIRQWFSNKIDVVSGRYVLMITTLPSLAEFEVMVDYDVETEDGTREKMVVIGEPIRVNKYGTQSHCVSESFLKSYCYCTTQLQTRQNIN